MRAGRDPDIEDSQPHLGRARMLGLLLAVGTPIATMTSILISFRYAMFSIGTSIIVIGGEAPYLLQLCPAGKKCSEWTDSIFGASEKAYVYGLVSLIGILLFFTINWNLLLFIVHLLLGLLAYLYHKVQKEFNKMPPSLV